MEDIQIRNFEEYDISSIQEILSNLQSPSSFEYNATEIISRAIKDDPEGIFVACCDDKILGFAIVVFRESYQIAFLDSIAVEQESYGKGISEKLLERCIQRAKAEGARIIYTQIANNNKNAIAFYHRCKFKPSGHIPEFYRKGLDAIIMVKKLVVE